MWTQPPSSSCKARRSLCKLVVLGLRGDSLNVNRAPRDHRAVMQRLGRIV